MLLKKYNFGVIRTLRHRTGLTMEQMAKKSGLTYPTVATTETRKCMPSLRTLDAIAGILKITVSELIALAEQPVAQANKADSSKEKGKSSKSKKKS